MVSTDRRLIFFALLIALLLPGHALAQENEPIPPPPGPSWSEMRDISGYVSFSIAQCGACNGHEPAIGPPLDTDFPTLSWDLGKTISDLFSWLFAGIANLFRWLVCWFLAMIQHLLNALAVLVNSLIWIANQIWRFLIFAWLTIRSLFYALWFLYETLRDMWQELLQTMALLWQWLRTLLDLAVWAITTVGEMLLVLGEMLLVLSEIVLSVVGILSWIGGLIIGLALDVLESLQGTTLPVELSGTHMAYAYVRGMLDGIIDSQIGWIFWLYIGMAYVGFISWLSRFFGGVSKDA